MKIALPVLLAGIVMIAGIFAFMPVDKATTVHTTIQSTQLNNIASTFDLDLATNATASCGASGGDFMVYFTFTNATIGDIPGIGTTGSTLTRLGITNGTADSDTDYIVTLVLGNQTSASGVIGADSGETINFFGFSNGSATSISFLEDVGDLALTVACRSGSTPALVPAP